MEVLLKKMGLIVITALIEILFLTQILNIKYVIFFLFFIIISGVLIKKNDKCFNSLSSKKIFGILFILLASYSLVYYFIKIKNIDVLLENCINLIYGCLSIGSMMVYTKKNTNHSRTLFIILNSTLLVGLLSIYGKCDNILPLISLYPIFKYIDSKKNKMKNICFRNLLLNIIKLIYLILMIKIVLDAKITFTTSNILGIICIISILPLVYYVYNLFKLDYNSIAEKNFQGQIIPTNNEIKKVSAVIPNYNYANYIKERIDSVLNQNYPIYELIILDDKSKDNSVEVINELLPCIKEKYPNLKVKFIENKKNSGNVFKQWEKAFEFSTGDYLWICEADDGCSNCFLNRVMKSFDDKNVVISYSESKAIDENGNVFKEDLRDWIDIFQTGHWNYDYIESGKHELKYFLSINNTIANVSGVVFNKNAKIDYKRYLKEAQKFTLAGDWYFYSKVLLHGKISYVAESLNYHRIHSSSVTNTTDNFIHFKEIKYIQESIDNDVKLPNAMKERVNLRNVSLLKNLCISEDELKYDKISLNSLLQKKKINDEILLSIIIPVYNVEKYITKCLKSVFKNLPKKTEVIIINDGSPDNSEKIITNFARKYKQIKYIKKENGGLSSVKNLGLKLAKGRYVIFLDSDDYVSSNMYETMLKKIIDTDADLVYCDVLMTYEDGKVNYVTMKNMARNDQLMQILDGNLMAASWNKMVKKELYDGLEFPEGLNNEDIAVSPILFLRSKKIEYIQSPFYKYVQRTGSIQNSGFNEKRFVIFKTAKICFDAIKNYDYVSREKIIGAIVTHQLLAILIYLIFPIENYDQKLKYLKIFCKEFKSLNLDLTNNQYVVEYLHFHKMDDLVYIIENELYQYLTIMKKGDDNE